MRVFLALLALPLALTAACAQPTPAPPDPAHAQVLAPPGTPTPAWVTLETAQGRTQADTSRIVLVHAYADWCPWCRRMEAQTYADSTVRAYLGQYYEPVRLDIEGTQQVGFADTTITEAELASVLGVSGVPATVFLEPSGQILTMLPGYVPPDRFIHVLRFLAERIYQQESFAEYIQRVEAPAPASGG